MAKTASGKSKKTTAPRAKKTVSKTKRATPGTKSAAAKSRVEKKTAIVTGAAGFVGSHVVDELLAAGMNVIATDYPGANLSGAEAAGAQIAEADISCAESIEAVFKNRKIDYVVHVAALYDLGAEREALMLANRDGSRNVFQACLDAKVKHVVYFSSGDVYGQPKVNPVSEDYPPHPINAYAESKLAGEKIALEMHRQKGLPVTVIRPTIVYGPRSKYIASVFFSIPGIVRSIGNRIAGLTGASLSTLKVFKGGTLFNWVHAKDLAGAVYFLLEKDEAVGEVYNVADDRPITLEELFGVMFHVFGYEWEGVLPYPKGVVSFIAKLAIRLPDTFMSFMTEFMRKEWEQIREKYDLSDDLVPRFDRDFLSYMLGDRVFDNTKIKQLGYKFRYPDAIEGFNDTIAWYQEKRWLPRIEEEEALSA